MRTAADAARRIMWDATVDRADFVVGYLDRFRGVLEKSFDTFNWGKLEMAGHFDLAIPQHRIQYFKYRGYIVWEKATRIDRIFGSTAPYEKITDVQAQMEAGKIRVNGRAAAHNTNSVNEVGDRCSDKDDETKTEDGVYIAANDDEDEAHQRTTRFRVNDRPNYFVSFKISDPTTAARLVDVQRQIVQKDARLQAACLPSACFHVTLVTLQLRNEAEIETARAAIEEAKELLRVYLARDVRLTIASLQCFRQQVLHACVAEHGRLRAFVEALKQVFRSHHLRLAGNYDPFTPHITLIKLNREMCRNTVATIDEHLWYPMQHHQFGQQAVESIHLCKMTATEKHEVTGFYRCLRTIANTLPATTNDAAAITASILGACQTSQVMVIMRGIPGSGKSTVTSALVESLRKESISCAVASADQYFVTAEGYQYRKEEIQAAHDVCRQRVEAALAEGTSVVIVDNTNTQLVAYERYIWMAETVGAVCIIVECRCVSQTQAVSFCERNVHDVDAAACLSMWHRWQPDPGALCVDTSSSQADEAARQQLLQASSRLTPLYIGVLLTEESQQLLLSKVQARYPHVKGHHVTLRYLPTVAQLLSAPLGKECEVTVRMIAADGYCQAAVVELEQEELLSTVAGDDCLPHITISHVKSVKPADSLGMLLRTPGVEMPEGAFQLTGVLGALVRMGGRPPVTLTATQDLYCIAEQCRRTEDTGLDTKHAMLHPFLPSHVKPHTVKHLSVFDLDNTLIQTPSRADYQTLHGKKWKGKGWWAHQDSLDDTLPFSVASGMQVLLESAGRPHSATVILTGRVAPLAEAVRRILQRFGIDSLIDAIICKPPDRSPTPIYKREAMRHLMQSLPALQTVTVWDDDAENMVEMAQLQEAFPKCKLEIFSCLHLSQASSGHLPIQSAATKDAGLLRRWAAANHLLTTAQHETAFNRAMDMVTQALQEINPAALASRRLYQVYGSSVYGRQSDVDIVLFADAEVDKKELLQRLLQKLASRSFTGLQVYTYFANSNRCPRGNVLFQFDELPLVDLDMVIAQHDADDLEAIDLDACPEMLGLVHLERVQSRIGGFMSLTEFGAVLCAACRIFEQAHAFHTQHLFTVRTFQVAQLLADVIANKEPLGAPAARDSDVTYRYFADFVQQMAGYSIAQWRQALPAHLVADCHLPRIATAFEQCRRTLDVAGTPSALTLEQALQPALASPAGYAGCVTISWRELLDQSVAFQAYNGVTGLLHKYVPRITGEGIIVGAGPIYRQLAFKRPIVFYYRLTGTHVTDIVRRHMDSFVRDAHASGYGTLEVEIK